MRSTTLATSRFTNTPISRAISRGVLGTAGILWVAIAASLCGCSPIAPVNGWAMNHKGKSYYKKGEYVQARQEFERALMDSPQSADYAYNVAAAMDQQGDHLAAEKMYRHALTLDPSHQPAYHGMAAMMIEDGRTTDANDLVSTWAATQPYSPEAATELGWLKGEQGDIDGADRELRRALRQNPRHSGALKQLGRVHRKGGRNGEAAADYARSLFMEPGQSDAQAELAAINGEIYGDPALQMAAAMPLYDPTLQPSAYPAYPAFTNSPQSQMATNQSYSPNWSGTPAQFTSSNGVMSSLPMTQTNWSSSPGSVQQSSVQPGSLQPIPMQSAPSNGYPISAYPGSSAYSNTVPMQYATPQSYNTARPASTSFFQPQQSFNPANSGQMLTSSPTPTPIDGYPLSSGFNEAPSWNAQPTLNAVPAAQMSSVPVVPAF